MTNQLPPWSGTPRDMGDIWMLTKGTSVAVCRMWTHSTGGEVRLEVDGEMVRSQAGSEWKPLVVLAMDWRDQFMKTGWA